MATHRKAGARSAIDQAAKIAVLRYLGHGLTKHETAFCEANPTLIEAVSLAVESGDFFMTHEVYALMDGEDPFYVAMRRIGDRVDYEREARKRTFPRNPALRRKLAEVLERLGHIPEKVLSSGMSRLQAVELRDATIGALRDAGVVLANHVAGAPREEWTSSTVCSNKEPESETPPATTPAALLGPTCAGGSNHVRDR
jgi:hypothetical protein